MIGLKRYERRIEEKNYLVLAMKILTDVVVVVGVALFLFVYFGNTAVVSGYSMDNTLTNNDVVLIDKFTYAMSEIERFDIIVYGADSGKYVKRVIGLPGERIKIENGKVYIDGKVLRNDVSSDAILSAGVAEQEIVLAKDEYFVLGDNRNNSEDSRFETVGNIKRDNIIGKAWFEITGITDFGFIE